MSVGMMTDSIMFEALLAHILRRPAVFAEARERLRPEHLSRPSDAGYAAIWSAMCEYYERYQQMPGHEMLCTLAISHLRQRCSDDRMFTDVQHLLSWAWGDRHQADSDFNDDVAISHWLRKFLIQREIQTPLLEALTSGDASAGALDTLMPQLAARHEQLQAIQQPANFVGMANFNEQQTVYAGPQLATGIRWIDERMDGGMRPPEVNVLLGPTGVGKTLLALQLFCSMLSRTDTDVASGVSEPMLHVYVCYEGSLATLQMRALCAGAQISSASIKEVAAGRGQYSRAGALKPYEHALEGWAGAGEQERRNVFIARANNYAAFLDFSGGRAQGAPRGFGGIPEIAGALRQVQQQSQRRLGVIFIDWAGMACRRYMASKNEDQKMLTHHLGGYVDLVNTSIAEAFGCSVLVMHQLSGEANKKKVTSVPHHSQAEWCSGFAQNAAFACCLGQKDAVTSTCQFVASKTRSDRSHDALMIEIQGDLGRMVDATGRFRLDGVSGRVLPAEMAAAVVGEAATDPQAAQAQPAAATDVQRYMNASWPGHPRMQRLALNDNVAQPQQPQQPPRPAGNGGTV